MGALRTLPITAACLKFGEESVYESRGGNSLFKKLVFIGRLEAYIRNSNWFFKFPLGGLGKMKKFFILALASVAVSACAKRPDAIVPVDIPMAAYTGQACPKLADALKAEKEKLATLSTAQNSAATSDALGVFLIGVPVSSLTGGDQEGTIAVSKGKVQSIELVMQTKNCTA